MGYAEREMCLKSRDDTSRYEFLTCTRQLLLLNMFVAGFAGGHTSVSAAGGVSSGQLEQKVLFAAHITLKSTPKQRRATKHFVNTQARVPHLHRLRRVLLEISGDASAIAVGGQQEG